MSAFPLEPRYSRALVSAAYSNCLFEMLTVLSMLYVCPVFYVPAEKREQFFDVSPYPPGRSIAVLPPFLFEFDCDVAPVLA